MQKRGQIAMEYITILGFVVVSTLIMIVIFHAEARDMNDTVVSHQVERLAEKIVDTAEAVHFIGEPSRTKLKLYFPPNIVSNSMSNRELIFNVKTSFGVDEVIKVSQVNLTGILPTTSGIHYVQVEARDGEVHLS
jgi:hypothetical protein